MGSIFRGEHMVLCQLFLPQEMAYNVLAEVGECARCMFKDLNKKANSFSLPFIAEVRRCEELERKLLKSYKHEKYCDFYQSNRVNNCKSFLEAELKRDKMKITDLEGNPSAPSLREISEVEAILERLEKDTREINNNYDVLKTNLNDLIELRHVLIKSTTFFSENEQVLVSSEIDASPTDVSNLGFVTGVIQRRRVAAFERLLWRACRGNVFLRLAEIETEVVDASVKQREEDEKSVFLMFYQGDTLKAKVQKICDGFHAKVYQCPQSASERRETEAGVATRIEDLKLVVNQTEEQRHRVLTEAATHINEWTVQVRKMKTIYHIMNMCTGTSGPADIDVKTTERQSSKALIGECWVPVKSLDVVQEALQRGKEKSCTILSPILSLLETKQRPPTYYRTNKFTKVYQTIVDAYGVAVYQEANPAPFSMITFPFLFSVMFGDLGHGFIMFCIGFWMVAWEKSLGAKKSSNEIWKIYFGGRYIIMLNGAFSVYSGFVYNNFFAQSINMFGSAWYPSPARYPPSLLETTSSLTLDPTNDLDYTGVPYPFGVDPIWGMASNSITFLNSYKMKQSIIFGVSQMLFGVCISITNHLYNGDVLSIVCEFIPQMLFLLGIFGYLIVLIFYKWIVFNATESGCAPSLLIDLINMFLLTYPSSPCSVVTFYQYQEQFQIALLILVVICIPWLLLPKPLILRHINNKKEKALKEESDKRKLIAAECIELEHPSQVQPVTAEIPSYETTEQADIANASPDAVIPTEINNGKVPVVADNISLRSLSEDEEGEEKFDFGEIFVHQCIHTIEYCLGCISHTASYLRLWALSLAHSELSLVLWDLILELGFRINAGYGGIAIVFCFWYAWAILTAAILLCMEGLSAFLHTLRLHWVEFQSKFYKGDGYTFRPMSFKWCYDLKAEDPNDTK